MFRYVSITPSPCRLHNILKGGASTHDALIVAGSKGFDRSSETSPSILALIPMSFGYGEGSELSAPLARTVMGGLSSSFIFTLIFVPVVYSLFEDLSARIRNRFTGKR